MDSEYLEIVRKIEKVRDRPARVESLERFGRALAELAPPFPADREGIILVAGTNGKGSVAKTLETLLRVGGESVGLYTSPHLIDTTERIRSHGKDLSRKEFVETYRLVQSICERHSLGHFETLTLMMCEAFFGGRVRPRVERAVIEVGVGGRLDPTRLIPHDASVITWLGVDHQDLLGPGLEQIAAEKLAIIDAGNLVVHAPFPPEARVRTSPDWIESKIYSFRVERGRWILQTPWGEVALGLLGERAVQNTSIALSVLEAQGRNLRPLLPALANVRWPGRMELVQLGSGVRLYLSGDHNAQGVRSLNEIFSRLEYRRVLIVAGVGEKKDHEEMLSALQDLPRAELFLTSPPFKGSSLSRYGEWLSKARFADEKPEVVLRRSLAEASSEDLVLVTGSLYLVGFMRRLIRDGAFGKSHLE